MPLLAVILGAGTAGAAVNRIESTNNSEGGFSYLDALSTAGQKVSAVNLGRAGQLTVGSLVFDGNGSPNPTGIGWSVSAPNVDNGLGNPGIDDLFFSEVWGGEENVLRHTGLDAAKRYLVQVFHGEPRDCCQGTFSEHTIETDVDTAQAIPEFVLGNSVGGEAPPAADDVRVITVEVQGVTEFTYTARPGDGRGQSIAGFQVRDLGLIVPEAIGVWTAGTGLVGERFGDREMWRWEDRAGGHHLAAHLRASAPVGLAPTLRGGATPNGTAAVNFEGSGSNDAYTTVPGLDQSPVGGATSFTVAAVFRPESNGDSVSTANYKGVSQIASGIRFVASNDDSWGLGYADDQVFFGVGDARRGENPTLGIGAGGVGMSDAWWVAVGTWTAVGESGFPTFSVWVYDTLGNLKGALVDRDVNAVAGTGGAFFGAPRNPRAFGIGAKSAAGANDLLGRNFDGQIADVRLYDGWVDGGAAQAIASELAELHLSQPAGNLVVTSLADSGPGSLRQAIEDLSEVPAPRRITFGALSGTITLESTLPEIDRDVVIDGGSADVTVSGAGARRLFEVFDGGQRVVIRDLMLRDGRADGGAVARLKGDVTVVFERCRMTGNVAPGGAGGQVAVIGVGQRSTCVIESCLVDRNHAENSIIVGSGEEGTLLVSNSTFTENTAGTDVRAIDDGGSGMFEAIHCTVVNNRGEGGGVAGVRVSGGPSNVSGCIIAGNTQAGAPADVSPLVATAANFVGGVPGLEPLRENGSGTDRRMTMMPMHGSAVVDAVPAGGSGGVTDGRGAARVVGGAPDFGAVEVSSAVVATTTGASLKTAIEQANANRLDYVVGGVAAPLASNLPQVRGGLSLVSSGPLENVVDGNGERRVFDVGVTGFLGLWGITVRDGHVAGVLETGAGIRVLPRGELAMAVCEVVGCEAVGGSGGGIAGGVFSRITIERTTMTGNAAANGGGISSDGELIVENSTLFDNEASGAGGGIDFDSGSGGLARVAYTTITGNRAGAAGAILLSGTDGSRVELAFSILGGNDASEDIVGVAFTEPGPNLFVAEPGVGDVLVSTGFQRVLPPLAGSPAVMAAGVGGDGILADQLGNIRKTDVFFDLGAVDSQAELLVTSPFDDVEVAPPGSLRQAVRMAALPGAVIRFSRDTFDPAENGGEERPIVLERRGSIVGEPNPRGHLEVGEGALVIDATDLPEGTVRVRGAIAPGGTTSGLPLLWVGDGDVTLRGLRFEGSAGFGAQSAVECRDGGKVVLDRCGVSGFGRTTAVENERAAVESSGTLTVTGSTLDGNLERAVSIDGGTAQIERSRFVGNRGEVGSAVDVVDGDRAIVEGCYFGGNHSTRSGVVSVFLGDVLVVRNSTFFGNSGEEGAGAIGTYGGVFSHNVTVYHCTVSGNTCADGPGGIGVGGLTLLNSIVFGNTGGGGSPDDVDGRSGAFSPGSSGNLLGEVGALIELSESDIVGVDPLLAAPGSNGGETETMALLAGSPAIDAASEGFSLPTDQRGVARPQGAASDIGAFEVAASAGYSAWAAVNVADPARRGFGDVGTGAGASNGVVYVFGGAAPGGITVTGSGVAVPLPPLPLPAGASASLQWTTDLVNWEVLATWAGGGLVSKVDGVFVDDVVGVLADPRVSPARRGYYRWAVATSGTP